MLKENRDKGASVDNQIIEISASLSEISKDKKVRLLEEIVSDVYNNRRNLKNAIMECDVNPHNFAYITLDLGKVSKRHIKNFRLNLLLDGTFPLKRCFYCGCYYITYHLYTYRDNGGCIGRSYECISCRNLSNKSVCEIHNVSQKLGVRNAKEYQLKILRDEEGYSLSEEKIIRLDIVDEDAPLKDRLQCTYYLVNPDEDKLQEFKSMVENRYMDEENGIENSFIGDFCAVMEFVTNNFRTLDIETREVKW